MKYLLSTLLLSSFSAFAGVSDVPPSTDPVMLSRVEQIIEVQKSPRIALVKIDNGGSTDITSAVMPSSLFLTAFNEGEMSDIDAQYVVTNSLVKVKRVWFNGKTGLVTIESTRRDDNLKEYTVKTKVYIADLLKEIKDAADKGEEGHVVTSPIGVETVK